MDIQYFIEQVGQDKLLVYAFPLFLAVVLVEMYIDKQLDKELYLTKDFWVSFSMAIIKILLIEINIITW